LAEQAEFAAAIRQVAPPPPPAPAPSDYRVPPPGYGPPPQPYGYPPPQQQYGYPPQPPPKKMSLRAKGIVSGIAVVALGSCVAYAATSGSRAAKAHYDECMRLVQEGQARWGPSYVDSGALSECRMAVNADPNSAAGKAAAKFLADQDAAQKQKDAARAAEAKAAQQASIAMYSAMTATEREAAMYACFGTTPDKRCSDSKRSDIIAGATDPTEQGALKALNAKLTPQEVNFDQLKKLAETGMPLGQPYKICAYYYPNDISQFCKYNGKYCDAYLSVDDNFAVGSDEKKALFDRRDKTGCFEVKMFRGGNLLITALL
jgi:hypothetical protein